MTEPNGKPSERPLSKKQLDFCLGIVEGKADFQAYMDAYGSERPTAEANAPRLLGNDRIQKKIEELRSAIVERVIERTAITKEWVMAGLVENAEIALGRRGANGSDGKPTLARVYKGSWANKALELIGTELGMFKVRVQDIPWDELEPEDLKQIERGVLPFKLRRLA